MLLAIVNMKISSNFHDYYDALRSSDLDDEPLYVRLTKNINLAENPERFQPYRIGRREDPATVEDRRQSYEIRGRVVHFRVAIPWIESRAIGFCGRVYPFVTVGYGKNVKHAFTPERARKLVQDFKMVAQNPDEVIDHKTIRDQKNSLLNVMSGGHAGGLWMNHNHFNFNDWAPWLANNTIGDLPFRHFKAPILMFEFQGPEPYLVVNPILRQYDFVQVMTPHQAYQELSMYVGNNLANLDRKEPRPITDKLKSETKGFDKWSFKNQKNRKVSDRGDW